MRGADTFTESLFTMQKLEDFVPADHPLRPIRQMVNAALVKMDALISGMYEAGIKGGRRISPVIHQVFPLQQASKAHALIESSEHIGKIMQEV